MRKILVFVIVIVAALMASAVVMAQDETTTTTEATPWLGIAVAETDGQVVIARVQSGSPADAADLLIGDVVTAYNGTAVETAAGLGELVKASAPGDVVTLSVTRNAEAVEVEVTLGTLPTRSRGFGRGLDNLPTDALSAAEVLLHADLQEAEAGFEVVNVFAPRNPLELVVGDVVTAINGQTVSELNLETLATELEAMDTPTLTVTVTRDGEEVTLESGAGFGHRDGRGGFDGGRGSRRGGRGFGLDGSTPSDKTTPQLDNSGSL